MTTVVDLHERNLAILADSDAGVSNTELGRRYELSTARIGQILARESVRRRHPTDRYPIDPLLRSAAATYGQGRANRLRNLLVRSRITTPEQVSAATDDELLGIIGFGRSSLRIARAVFGTDHLDPAAVVERIRLILSVYERDQMSITAGDALRQIRELVP